MATRNPSFSYQLRSLVTLLCRYGVVSVGGSRLSHQIYHTVPPPYGGGSPYQGLRRNEEALEKQVQQTTPIPSKFGFSNWLKWLLGSIVSILLPLWKNKWDNMLALEGKAAKVAEEVEVVAEVVEKVATTAEKTMEEVENQLPDDSKLKEVVQVMEHVSSVAAHDAQLIESIIKKVDDVKQDVENLEKLVEPIVDKITQRQHPKN